MRTPVLLLAAALVGAATPSAQAGERGDKGLRERPAASDQRPARDRRAYRTEPDDDTPWGPIHPSQDDVRQSMYDFSAGKKANIKEYWWRY